jgi:hypothetical protein
MLHMLSVKLRITEACGYNKCTKWRQIKYQNRHWDTDRWGEENLDNRRKDGEMRFRLSSGLRRPVVFRRTVLPPYWQWRWGQHDPLKLGILPHPYTVSQPRRWRQQGPPKRLVSNNTTTVCHNPEDSGLNLHCRENLKYVSIYVPNSVYTYKFM